MQTLYVLRICAYPSHKYETNQNTYINQFKSIDYPTYIHIYEYIYIYDHSGSNGRIRNLYKQSKSY